MRHRANQRFWRCYDALPNEVKQNANKAFQLLVKNTQQPSLRFKKVGPAWSARVDRKYRALAYEVPDGFLWFWIGRHDEYMRQIPR